MKILFSSLVLINFGYYMWQSWYVEPENSAYTQYAKPEINADKMGLISEMGKILKRRSTAATPRTGLTDVTPERMCYRIGPFAQEQAALDVRRWLADRVVTAVPREVEQTRTIYRVLIAPLTSAKEVSQLREQLTQFGFTDHAVVTDSDKIFAISAGVFSVKANADKRMTALKKKGILAKREILKPTRRQYWLEVKADSDLSRTLLRQKWSAPKATAKAVDCDSEPPGVAKLAKNR